jgi:hypothetical protein
MARRNPLRSTRTPVSHRLGNGRFGALFSGTPSKVGVLPLTHMTDVYGFRQMLDDGGIIKPQHCPIFEKRLSYFFYGRPAYRVNPDIDSNALLHYAPVCLLLEAPAVAPIAGLYPFDTGAFAAGRLAASFHRGMIKEDFALGSNLDAARLLIEMYFGTDDAYYTGDPRMDLTLSSFALEGRAYHELLKSGGAAPFDDRASTVELQVEAEIPFGSSLIAAVIPEPIADEPAVIDALKARDAVAMPYDVIRRMKSTDYAAEIYRHVRDFYRSRKLLNV